MESLDPIDKVAWRATINVIENFLGNKRADNYEELVREMIEAYRNMGVHMSLKIHFLPIIWTSFHPILVSKYSFELSLTNK